MEQSAPYRTRFAAGIHSTEDEWIKSRYGCYGYGEISCPFSEKTRYFGVQSVDLSPYKLIAHSPCVCRW